MLNLDYLTKTATYLKVAKKIDKKNTTDTDENENVDKEKEKEVKKLPSDHNVRNFTLGALGSLSPHLASHLALMYLGRSGDSPDNFSKESLDKIMRRAGLRTSGFNYAKNSKDYIAAYLPRSSAGKNAITFNSGFETKKRYTENQSPLEKILDVMYGTSPGGPHSSPGSINMYGTDFKSKSYMPIVAHELGHAKSFDSNNKIDKFFNKYYSGGSRAGMILSAISSRIENSRLDALDKAKSKEEYDKINKNYNLYGNIANTLSTLAYVPVLGAELNASTRGFRYMGKNAPLKSKLKTFAGVPTYLTAALLPIINSKIQRSLIPEYGE